MNIQTGNWKKTRWAWAIITVVAVVAIAGAAVAKEKGRQAKEKTAVEKPDGATGNGYLGVYMQELTTDVRKGLDLKVDRGVLVSGVEDDAPAAKAGIEEGDVIVGFNGKKVSSPEDLRAAVRAVDPGQEARIEVIHDGKSRTLTVTVGEQPDSIRWHSNHWNSDEDFTPAPFGRGFTMMMGPRLGVQVHELDDNGLASYFGAKKGEGLLVLSVDDESVAGKAGVQPGDIISKVGNDKIEDSGDVRNALRDYKEGDQFDITVLRHGKTQSLKATMDVPDNDYAFRMPNNFHWHGNMMAPPAPRAPRAPRAWTNDDREDLRRELNDLKDQIQELKEQLKDRNDG